MKKTYNNYNKFDSINYAPLKGYNRLVTAASIKEELSVAQAALYLAQFSDKDKFMIAAVGASVEKLGNDHVKRALIRRMNELGIGSHSEEE